MIPHPNDAGRGGGEPGRRSRRPRILAGATFLVLLLAAMAMAFTASEQNQRREDAELSRRTDDAVDAVRARMSDYIEVLYGTRGLFTASEYVSRAEFHRHVESLDLPSRYPGLQVLGFAGRVAAADVAEYEKAVTDDAAASGLPYPPFAVYGDNPTGERFVIDRIEPQRGNEKAFGLDFLSEPNRRAAVEAAVATDRPSGTAPITLVQETGQQAGFLVDLPVFAARAVPATPGERRRDAVGVVYAAFRMGDLLKGVLGAGGRDEFDLEVYDVGSQGADIAERSLSDLTYDQDGLPRAVGDGGSGGLVRGLTVAGRSWAVYYRPTDSLLSSRERALPAVIAIVGGALGLLAAALVGALSEGRARALALAEEMTADLRASREDLSRSNAELEQFAYVASHDLREPLRTVANFVGLLKRRYGGALDEKANQYMDFAVDGAERMSRLIDDLLDYSRVGATAPPTQPTALDDAWDLAVENLALSIEESGATVSRDHLPLVTAGGDQMVQVFQNLLSNAIKYRGDEPPRVCAAAARVDGDWRITVADNGIGIDPSHREIVFQMFQRLHTARDYEGTGMGLAVARRTVVAMGGQLTVADHDGPGTTFAMTLPAGEVTP